MLRRLLIRNLAILPEVDVEFAEGLNVLTGETGAGKSILVDAVNLLAGGRASSEDVRAGESAAEVTGWITVPKGSPFRAEAKTAGVPDTPEFVLKRTVGADGRSRAFLNDVSVPAALLARVAEYWADLSAQHGQQQLLAEEFHVWILDAYGELEGKGAAYRDLYASLRRTLADLADLNRRRDEALKQRDFLSFQLRDLREAQLRPGEEQELESLHARTKNAAALADATAAAEAALDGDGGAQERLGAALSALRSAARLDPSMARRVEEAERLLSEIRSLSAAVAGYGTSLDVDPGEIDRVNERISRLQAIRRKYGSVEAAIAERDRIAELLGALEDFDAQEERLRTASREAEAALVKGAAALSAGRKRAAARFAEEVSEELRHLGMPSAELRVVLVPPEVGDSAVRVGDALYGPFGAEEARILFAPNPGEGFRPLAKIASGGELSRVLLALKSVALARAGSTGVTYLFDEIDTGIGGETAERVGIRLKALARGRQVLCVTHLAQLAGYADTHLRIRKDVRKGRTEASVTALADTEKVEELARMIGGIEVTRKSRDHAEELLRRGQTGRRSKAVLTAG